MYSTEDECMSVEKLKLIFKNLDITLWFYIILISKRHSSFSDYYMKLFHWHVDLTATAVGVDLRPWQISMIIYFAKKVLNTPLYCGEKKNLDNKQITHIKSSADTFISVIHIYVSTIISGENYSINSWSSFKSFANLFAAWESFWIHNFII